MSEVMSREKKFLKKFKKQELVKRGTQKKILQAKYDGWNKKKEKKNSLR